METSMPQGVLPPGMTTAIVTAVAPHSPSTLLQVRENRTDVGLNLEMNSPFPPGSPPHMRGRSSCNAFSLLPALVSPEGANQMGGGDGGRLNSAYADTTLETNYILSTLAAHYKTQLEQAGCVLTGEGQSGPLAWISWTLKEDDDELWHGLFFILKELDQEYFLTMRIQSDKGGK
jgi:hypothetical protein